MRHSYIFSGIVAAAAVAFASSTPTAATSIEEIAQLTGANGKVLVNQGTGFVQPSDGMSLKTGDRIFVGHEASALITYVVDGCKVAVPEDRVLAIDAISPCQRNAVQIKPAADLPQTVQAYEPEFPALPVALFAVGGGVLISCVVWWCDDDDEPLSK